jgi:hypothetical protein
VTSGDLADILEVADTCFQAVDQVQARLGKSTDHGFTLSELLVAANIEQRFACWVPVDMAMVAL